MAVGDPEVSSEHHLTALLSGAAGGGLSAIARLLDTAAFSVAVFQRSDGVRIAYLNRSAAAVAGVANGDAVGRPAREVFPQVEDGFISGLLDGAVRDAVAMNMRGLLPGGAAWSLDAVALDRDTLLVIAEELGHSVSSRQRLEALLASMDAIWRATDLKSMAAEIVDQAGRLFVDVDIALYEVDRRPPFGLTVLAANADWLHSAAGEVEDGTVVVDAAARGQAVEVMLPADVVVVSRELQPAGVHAVRAVPLTAFQRVGEGTASLGLLLFVKRSPGPFRDPERHLMDEFAKLVGLAAHRAALLADARGSAHRLQLTLDLAMAFASSQSPREVMQLLLKRTLDVAQADRATLSSIDEDGLTIEATYARSGELTWVGRRYEMEWLDRQPLVRQALETYKTVIGGRLSTAQAAPEFREALAAVDQTAILPLMLAGRPGGLLVVSRTGDRGFEVADVDVLELMGNAAMLALRNARLLEDLKAANSAKSEFLNLAAHELRTPVTVIKGYTSMLQGTIEEPEERQKALAIIQGKAAELARLVDSLLVTARLQNQPAAKSEAFDVVDIVRKAVERAGPYARLKGGVVEASVPEERVEAEGEADLVGRILDNLINNAIAYSEDAPRARVRVAVAGGAVEIDVEDHGRGIPESHAAKVFDAFVRVDDGRYAPGEGAGLGLYIARRLAENMGGELELVRSAPGDGSVFRLRLKRPLTA